MNQCNKVITFLYGQPDDLFGLFLLINVLRIEERQHIPGLRLKPQYQMRAYPDQLPFCPPLIFKRRLTLSLPEKPQNPITGKGLDQPGPLRR